MTTVTLGASSANPNTTLRISNSVAKAVDMARLHLRTSHGRLEMSDNTASRRRLLGALLVMPAAAIATSPALAYVPAAPGRASPDLVQAILNQRRASAFAHHYADTVHTPAFDAWQADAAQVPHVTTANSFASALGERVALSTSNDGTVATSRRVLANFDAGRLPSAPADYVATLRELIEAADERDVERERLRLRHRVDATGDRCDRLTDMSLEAIDAVLAIPARNVADLAAKIAFIGEVEWWDVSAAHDAISSDARCLAGEA